MGYTQVTSSLFTPISTNLGLNQASTYSNAGLGSLGTSMGSGDAFGELNIVLNPLFYYTNISSMGYTNLGLNQASTYSNTWLSSLGTSRAFGEYGLYQSVPTWVSTMGIQPGEYIQ